MNNKISFYLSKFNLLVGLVVLILAVPFTVGAQEITTTVRGTVTTPDGGPAAGAAITITDTRTNSRRSTTTSASGSFTVRGLGVGGPYTIRVDSDQYEDALVTGVYTNLS